MNANISVFNFDAFAAHYSDLDDTPYLAGGRALTDALNYVNGAFKNATIVQYLIDNQQWNGLQQAMNSTILNVLTDPVYPFDPANFAVWSGACTDQFI